MGPLQLPPLFLSLSPSLARSRTSVSRWLSQIDRPSWRQLVATGAGLAPSSERTKSNPRVQHWTVHASGRQLQRARRPLCERSQRIQSHAREPRELQTRSLVLNFAPAPCTSLTENARGPLESAPTAPLNAQLKQRHLFYSASITSLIIPIFLSTPIIDSFPINTPHNAQAN